MSCCVSLVPKRDAVLSLTSYDSTQHATDFRDLDNSNLCKLCCGCFSGSDVQRHLLASFLLLRASAKINSRAPQGISPDTQVHQGSQDCAGGACTILEAPCSH